MLRKVQVESMKYIKPEDRELFIESYHMLGFTTVIDGDDLICYWGTPDKPKKDKKKDREEEKQEHKPGQGKTARRLGRKFDG